MRGSFKRACIGMAMGAALAVSAPGAADAAQPLCGQGLTKSVRLTADLTCPGDGFVIGRSRITVDLGGHTLTGAGTAVSNLDGYDRITVRDGAVKGFNDGFTFQNSDWSRLAKLDVQVFGTPFKWDGGARVAVVHNSIAGSLDGLQFTNIQKGFVADNSIQNVAFVGIALRGSSGVVVAKNTTNVGGASLLLGDSQDNVVVGNDFLGDDFALIGASHNLVASNSIYRAKIMSGSNDHLIARNGIGAPPPVPGLLIDGSSGNVVRSNTGGGKYGFQVTSSATNTKLIGNRADKASQDGIKVEAPGTIIKNNIANDNYAYGINAVDGVIDGGGNRASGNGQPEQCIGVVCTP